MSLSIPGQSVTTALLKLEAATRQLHSTLPGSSTRHETQHGRRN